MGFFIVSILVLSAAIHFGIQKVFIRNKKFDDFNHRSSHKTLATRTGGIGVFFTALTLSLFYYFQNIELFDYSLFIPIGIMFFVGVYDDFYNADFKLKFFLQLIVGKIIVDQGYVITNYHGLFGLHEIPWLLAQLSTIFIFVLVVNAFNFIDGIDGLAIVQAIKSFFLLELFGGSTNPNSKLLEIIVISLLPLFYFNFRKKRKIFLGDAGSLLLGTIITINLFYLIGDNYILKEAFSINKTLLSIIIILYPLIDLLRVFVIRIYYKKSPFQPDQNHIHHICLKYVSKNHFINVIFILFIEIILSAILIISFK